jgi:hypothetical protein
VGYNPQKRGRPSYHPQLCRERRTGLSLWSQLRPGNTISSTDFVSFLEESWQVVPKRFQKRRRGSLCQVLARMDSGYESQDALGYTYVVLVTNLDWDEQDVYRFYDKRADMENHIQEAKADLELRLLALNQLVLFSRCVLGQTESRPRASTIRKATHPEAARLVPHATSVVSLPNRGGPSMRKSIRSSRWIISFTGEVCLKLTHASSDRPRITLLPENFPTTGHNQG